MPEKLKWHRLGEHQWVYGPYRLLRYRHAGGEYSWNIYWHLKQNPFKGGFSNAEEAKCWLTKNRNKIEKSWPDIYNKF